MKKKTIVVMLLILAMSFSMIGCSKTETNEDKAQNTDSANSDAGQTGTEDTTNGSGDTSSESEEAQYLNDYIMSEPTTMDVSLRSDSYSTSIINNVMEGLIRLEEKDGDYYMAPGDATSWESNEEGTVWTFHLGDNKWSDGEPVTAEQYVYSLQRSADPATGCPNSWFLTPILNYDAISTGDMDVSELGVRAIDEKTLEIELANSVPAFLEMCNATIYYPQREDKLTQWGEKYGTEAEYAVYNGPYVLDSWTHNSSLMLKKNPSYWDKDSVKIETVNISIMTDISTIVNAYRSGDIDAINVSEQEWLDEFQADESSKYVQFTTAGIVFNFFNTKDALFQNRNVRAAFSLAVDYEDINEMCFSGLRVPTYGWVVPTISVGDKNFREAAGDPIKDMQEELVAQGKTAKDLLIEGMEELGLGSDPSQLDVTLSLAGTSDWFKTYGEYLQQVYATELGVDLKINFSEWGIFSENLQNGNYQMGYMSWGAYYNDPYDVLSVFYSEWDQVGTGWGSEAFDELIDKASKEMNEDVRLQEYIEAEKIVLDDHVVAPLATQRSNIFYKDYVYGYGSLGFSTGGYKEMYVNGR